MTAQVLLEKKNWFGASELVKPEEIKSIIDHKNLRNWQVNQPLFDGSGRWREEMSIEEKKLFKAKGQKLLEELQYANNIDW